MGMSLGGGGGRRHGGRRKSRPVSDINVTPMVDVMLVLLVIFMVTAPLLTTGVDVNLPAAKTPQISQPDNKALTVTVKADGTLWIQSTQVDKETLVPRLTAIRGENADALVYVRGDAGINYGLVMEVLAMLRGGGFEKAALVTQPPSSGKK